MMISDRQFGHTTSRELPKGWLIMIWSLFWIFWILCWLLFGSVPVIQRADGRSADAMERTTVHQALGRFRLSGHLPGQSRRRLGDYWSLRSCYQLPWAEWSPESLPVLPVASSVLVGGRFRAIRAGSCRSLVLGPLLQLFCQGL